MARKGQKGNVVFKQSAEEATLRKMPKYNGFAGGYGAHGDTRYNRARERLGDWDLDDEYGEDLAEYNFC